VSSVRIAIQGQENSYHHQAALKLKSQITDFDNLNLELIYCSSFEEAFTKVKNGEADYALLAIENGVHGHIYQTLDIIMKNKAKILAEVYLPIHHQLAGLADDLNLVTDVYSHFAAFAQCDKFLENQLPDARHHVFEDTAAAAMMIKNDGDESKAAICSEAAALENGLKVISKNIENFNDNITRFFLLGGDGVKPIKLKSDEIDKTSLILKTSHQPGSLFKALEAFYQNNLNLSSLTSRPGEGGSINYRFYVEVETDRNDSKFKDALKKIESEDLAQVDILGSY
jgi:chorismate mutase/prephenate dehydratase